VYPVKTGETCNEVMKPCDETTLHSKSNSACEAKTREHPEQVIFTFEHK